MPGIPVAQKAGDAQEAAGMTDRLIAFMEQTGYQLGLPHLYYLKGQQLKVNGKLESASQIWRKGYAKAQAVNGRWQGWRLAVALAEAEELLGNEETAVSLRQEACTTFQSIIEQIPEGELRASFLALPAVEPRLN